jgi:hypothetical protein
VNSSHLPLVRSGADAGSFADLMPDWVRGCHPTTIQSQLPNGPVQHRHTGPSRIFYQRTRAERLIHTQAQHRAAGR